MGAKNSVSFRSDGVARSGGTHTDPHTLVRTRSYLNYDGESGSSAASVIKVSQGQEMVRYFL